MVTITSLSSFFERVGNVKQNAGGTSIEMDSPLPRVVPDECAHNRIVPLYALCHQTEKKGHDIGE
jgi:hypothetical protein